MAYALLFPGQGTLHAEVLPWLDAAPEAQAVLAQVSARVARDWRSRLADVDWRSTNAVAQPLVTGLSLAAWLALRPRLPPPEIVAGYSVGELAAFACAGVFGWDDALDLAGRRAAAMDRVVARLGFEGGLMAVDLPRASDFERMRVRFALQTAIEQAAGRRVVGGADDRLLAAADWIAAHGGLARRLEVRVPSHTAWMSPAVAEFDVSLVDVVFRPPGCPIALDATGSASRKPAVLRNALSAQIAQAVRWQACSQAIAERGVTGVLEVGPGHALARLWRDAYPDIPARSVDEFRDAEAAAEWLLMRLG